MFMEKGNEMYFELMREVEKAIRLLGEAQRKAEEMYLQVCAEYTNRED